MTSSYLRASQTAEIVAKELGTARKVETTQRLAPGGDPRPLINLIAARNAGRASVLVVGDEPCLSQLISVLVSGDERAAITMKKAGLWTLAVQTLRYRRCASLEWLLIPTHLEHIR